MASPAFAGCEGHSGSAKGRQHGARRPAGRGGAHCRRWARLRAAPTDTLPPGRKGLANIRARTQVLGGDCDWAAGEHGGTVFTLWLPLQRLAPQQPVAAA